MPEQNEQENLFQNQSNENEGSDLIKEDGGLLNGNNSTEQSGSKGFDLFQNNIENAIRNTNLNGDNSLKNMGKNWNKNVKYPGKKRRNARWIVAILMCGMLELGFLRIYQLAILNVLLIFFIIARIFTVRKDDAKKFIEENNIKTKLYTIIGVYVGLTAYLTFLNVGIIRDSYSINLVNDMDRYLEEVGLAEEYPEFYNEKRDDLMNIMYSIGNKYAGCDNCFGPNATNDIDSKLGEEFNKNVLIEFIGELGLEAAVYEMGEDPDLGKLLNKYEETIREIYYDSANSLLGQVCFGKNINTCNLSKFSVFSDKNNIGQFWKNVLYKMANEVDNKIAEGKWTY